MTETTTAKRRLLDEVNLCDLCYARQASTHIGSLFPDGLNGPSYGPFRVCSVCSQKPPEQLYRLARNAGSTGTGVNAHA